MVDPKEFVLGGESRCKAGHGPSDLAVTCFAIWIVTVGIMLVEVNRLNVKNKVRMRTVKDLFMSAIGAYIFYSNLSKCRAFRGLVLGLVLSSLGSMVLDTLFFHDLPVEEKQSVLRQLQQKLASKK